MSEQIKCPAAHRTRCRFIKGRDFAMAMAREAHALGMPDYMIRDFVCAARDAQHSALKFMRQDRSIRLNKE